MAKAASDTSRNTRVAKAAWAKLTHLLRACGPELCRLGIELAQAYLAVATALRYAGSEVGQSLMTHVVDEQDVQVVAATLAQAGVKVEEHPVQNHMALAELLRRLHIFFGLEPLPQGGVETLPQGGVGRPQGGVARLLDSLMCVALGGQCR